MATDYRQRMRGESNPRFSNAAKKTCEQCGAEFASYNHLARLCSIKCRDKSAALMGFGRGNRKDKNHDEIVAALKSAGAVVLDAAHMGHGFPDLIAGYKGVNYMIEIKNPNNHYGKSLTKRQREFHEECLKSGGVVVHVVRTPVQALVAIGAF